MIRLLGIPANTRVTADHRPQNVLTTLHIRGLQRHNISRKKVFIQTVEESKTNEKAEF